MTMVYGLILILGGTIMDSEIVKMLELMCDKENPQDKKLLLLAELVETKCEALSKSQEGLKSSLEETNKKLDKLTDIFEKYETDKRSCPVYRNKDGFERLSMFMKYPKITLLVVVGIFALMVGMLSTSAMDLLKFLFGL